MLRLKYFKEKDFETLRTMHENPKYTLRAIARELNCTVKTLQSAIEKLGLKRKMRVETWKIDYLQKNYSQPVRVEDMAKFLDMSVWHIYELAKQLNLKRPPGHVIRKLCNLEIGDNKPPQKVIVEDLGFNCFKRTNVVFHEKRI
jgi:AraC-like DNA-binding protein